MSRQTIAEKPPARNPQNPTDRNRDLLLRALAAGQSVTGATPDGRPMVPSRSDPLQWYTITRRSSIRAGNLIAQHETCECAAMDGGEAGRYHKEVVRWKNRDGIWQTNGVLPCGHILICRFEDQWNSGEATQRALLAAVPGLADAIRTGGQYQLPKMEA